MSQSHKVSFLHKMKRFVQDKKYSNDIDILQDRLFTWYLPRYVGNRLQDCGRNMFPKKCKNLEKEN